MGLIKRVHGWSNDVLDYISVNPTRDEVMHYRVDLDNEEDVVNKVHQLTNFGTITCLDYSQTVSGLVSVGETSGFVSLFNILDRDDEMTRLRAAEQRAINFLNFSRNGLIAIGLDKHKTDPGLQIWDMNYQNTDSNVIKPSFSYFPNETIVSTCFINDTNLLTSSSKFLRESDLRSPAPVFQFPTRYSYDIKMNWLDEWQFSSYGDDGTLCIWDRRKLKSQTPEALLTFESLLGTGAASRKYTSSCFRYSSLRNGEFATLHGGELIKRWNIGKVPDVVHDDYDDINSIEDDVGSLFVASVHDMQTDYDRVVTFDYVPMPDNSVSFLCMRQSGTIYHMTSSEPVLKADFDVFNDVMLCTNEDIWIKSIGAEVDEESEQRADVANKLRSFSFDDMEYGSDRSGFLDEDDEEHDEYDDYSDEEHSDFHIDAHELLQGDISVIMRLRALKEYGLDPVQTIEMIDKSKTFQNNAYLRNTWRWLSIARSAVSDGSMISGDLDLGYEGILGIWNGLEALSTQNRHDTHLTEKQFLRELDAIIKNKAPQFDAQTSFAGKSAKQSQRKLCMIIAGWDQTPKDYEERYRQLVKMDQYEKAAGWAVLFGDIRKAIEILSSSKKERLRLIATAVAGYMAYKDNPGNSIWKDQCRKMASELDDPYLRVIFAYVADNDWWDILDEPAISLRERLGVALRFLSDQDLTTFLNRIASKVIAKGELEGLILTGITPSGIDLLQSYVDKTCDIQTAALVSISGCPRYFQDSRVDNWIITYRQLLNSWSLFGQRSKFDILRTKLSKTVQGNITSKVTPRQIYLQCPKCQQNINNPIGANKIKMQRQVRARMSPTPGGALATKHKHICPHCGAPYPRCSICLLPLGTSNLPFEIIGNPDENYENLAEDDVRQRKRMQLNEWFSFCLTCNHGMHAGHAEEWFQNHVICPVPGCNCRCNQWAM